MSELKYEKGHYLAFVLDENTRAMLLLSFHPRFTKVYCHHVTIEFNLTAEKLEAITKKLGSKVKATLTGFSRNDELQVATVKVNGETKRPDGGTYHLTYSLTPPAKPVDSNRLLTYTNGEPQFPLDSEIVLQGEVKLVKM